MSRNIDYASADDRVLVGMARRGDMSAFEELVARHRDKIYARAFSILRDADDANDLSQEAWIKGWQRLAQFQGDSSFATWITRIVINLCLDQLRREKRLQAGSIEELDESAGGVERQMPVVTPNPDRGLGTGRVAPAHRPGAWPGCPLNTARRWCCTNLKSLNTKKIARRMGCSIGTVMSRLFYARRRMAALLAGLKLEDYR